MTYAGPLAVLGALLVLWAWVSARPNHPLSRLFYKRYRFRDGWIGVFRPFGGVPVRPPPRNLLAAARIVGVADLMVAALIALVVADDATAFALVAIGVGVQFAVLVVMSLWPREPA
jgi:hypothetical protein